MRRLLLALGVSTLAALSAAACSDSNGGSPGGQQDTPDGSTSAEGGGADSPTGPASDSFTVAALADTTVAAGRSTKVPLSIARGAEATAPVTVTVTGLPAGVTAGALVIDGTSGDLALTADASAALGTATATVTAVLASNSPVTLTAPLKLTVRAAPGTVDTSWGTQGSISGVFGDAFVSTFVDLLLAPDDSIYAVGTCHTSGPDAACAAHVKADGTLDTAYGTNGVGGFTGGAEAAGAALQADSKVFFVGGSGPVFNTLSAYIGRLTAAGKPDESGTFTADFYAPGTNASNPTTFSGFDTGNYLVLQRKKDGDIFVGWDNDDTGTIKPATMDLKPDGTLRTTYGTSGAARNGTGKILAMAMRDDTVNDGKLAVVWVDGTSIRYQEQNAGTGALDGTARSYTAAGVSRYGTLAGRAQLADGSIVVPVNQADGLGFYLAKFSPAGVPTTFGTAGLAGPFAVHGHATSIALQTDGKFVIAINASAGAPAGQQNEVLMRFDATGKLDPDFGNQGYVTSKTGTKSSSQKVVVQKSGRIIASVAEASPTLDSILVAYVP